ncbi:MAG: 7TM diverse intracellular signaling domain-containing protein [Agriterribacter sp.]
MLLLNANAQLNLFNKQEVNVASVQTELTLLPQQFEVATSAVAILNPNDIAGLHYKNTNEVLPASGKLRGNANSVNIYIKALFTNTSDTASNVFFYPGYYFKSVFLFKQSTGIGSNIQTVPELLPNFKYKESYRGIILQPKEKSYFYIQLQPVKIQVNTFQPELINPAFLSAHAARVREGNYQISILTYIIVGILGMMFIFSFANFIVTGKKEFMFYCLYTLANACILFGKTYLYLSTSDFNYFFEEYLDFMLLLGGIVFYIYFLRYFLEINSQSNKLLYRVLISIEVLAIIFSFVYSFTYFLSDTITGLAMMEMIMKYVILLIGFLFIIMGIRQRNKLMNYIVLGNVCVMVLGFVSLTIVVAPVQQSLVLSNALFYYEMGLVGELAFFLLGLTYKSRTELINKVKTEDAVSRENEKKDFEKQLAIIQARQEERNRISADMHDELGGGMTAIRLMSELAKQRIHTGDMPPEIEKISASANDLLSKMNAIIWSMSPANDTLPNLIAYIRSYAFEFFENTSIECKVNICEDIPAVEVTGVKRRNIFLAVKEALSNVARHAGADTVIVNIICDKNLKINIADNGKEIPPKEMELTGMSLSNMQKRMESVQGWFQVKNENGTIVILEIPF